MQSIKLDLGAPVPAGSSVVRVVKETRTHTASDGDSSWAGGDVRGYQLVVATDELEAAPAADLDSLKWEYEGPAHGPRLLRDGVERSRPDRGETLRTEASQTNAKWALLVLAEEIKSEHGEIPAFARQSTMRAAKAAQQASHEAVELCEGWSKVPLRGYMADLQLEGEIPSEVDCERAVQFELDDRKDMRLASSEGVLGVRIFRFRGDLLVAVVPAADAVDAWTATLSNGDRAFDLAADGDWASRWA